ncbi:MAG: PadR family transcriptional regulator [Candidatus Binatus sp.]
MKKPVANQHRVSVAPQLKDGASSRAAQPVREDPIERGGFTKFRPYKKASLELALLGLIAEVPGVSGYDIMKIFDLSMTHYWHAHPTQIYPTLERMEDFGLIKRRNVVQRKFPNKRSYTITPSGERLLIEWLESPFEGINLKHPPLLRCRFLGHLGPDGAIAVLKEERQEWTIHLKRYRTIEGDYFADGKGYRDVNAMFSMFTLRRGIDWMEENIRWCDWAMNEIERNRALFPSTNMRTELKPLVPFDPIKYRKMANDEMAAGMKKYNRRKAREKQRIEDALTERKHSKASRPYPNELDW